MTISTIIVMLGLAGVLLALLFDKMRPGFTLLSGAILFTVTGVITPEELLEGFSNKDMMTVAMLFLVGEGVKQSGALSHMSRLILPRRKGNVGGMLARILPAVSVVSMFLNNTAVVIVMTPIIKRWAKKIGVPATKFLIPLSYATILGGMCTLVGTSTNMVVNGMMRDAGFPGFTMFELGRIGGIIAVVGLLYIIFFSNMLLPDGGKSKSSNIAADEDVDDDDRVEVLLMPRFPGVGRKVSDFDFQRHYGGRILSIKRNGVSIKHTIEQHIFRAGDTLKLDVDTAFAWTWRDSSAFYFVSGGYEEPDVKATDDQKRRRWAGLLLLVFMVVGATIGDKINFLPGVGSVDMFLMASIVVVIMALTNMFPPKRYTKFITWDILIAIASAFAISQAMSNSGINDMLAEWILGVHNNVGPYGALALLYFVTMILTELITNSAAVAITFPVAVAMSEQMGIHAMPLFVAICIAASASFSTPIGYQTNLIVQGAGGYRFRDYIRIGAWLNIITFIISVTMIPRIWKF